MLVGVLFGDSSEQNHLASCVTNNMALAHTHRMPNDRPLLQLMGMYVLYDAMRWRGGGELGVPPSPTPPHPTPPHTATDGN